METTTQIKLYKEALTILKDKQTEFICNAIKLTNTTDENKIILKEHFFTQIPSSRQYTEIYNKPTFNKRVRTTDSTDIWFIHVSAMGDFEVNFKLRIKLLESIIKNLEK